MDIKLPVRSVKYSRAGNCTTKEKTNSSSGTWLHTSIGSINVLITAVSTTSGT